MKLAGKKMELEKIWHNTDLTDKCSMCFLLHMHSGFKTVDM